MSDNRIPQDRAKLLKKFFDILSESFYQTIKNSEQISEALDILRANGVDVNLIVELTLLYKDNSNKKGSLDADNSNQPKKIELTETDRKFLKVLNISMEDA